MVLFHWNILLITIFNRFIKKINKITKVGHTCINANKGLNLQHFESVTMRYLKGHTCDLEAVCSPPLCLWYSTVQWFLSREVARGIIHCAHYMRRLDIPSTTQALEGRWDYQTLQKTNTLTDFGFQKGQNLPVVRVRDGRRSLSYPKPSITI